MISSLSVEGAGLLLFFGLASLIFAGVFVIGLWRRTRRPREHGIWFKNPADPTWLLACLVMVAGLVVTGWAEYGRHRQLNRARAEAPYMVEPLVFQGSGGSQAAVAEGTCFCQREPG